MAKRLKLSGEFELIQTLTASLPLASDDFVIANGDDASVQEIGGQFLVQSTDTFVEGRHFSFAFSTPKEVGQRLIECAASDVVAMGAKPEATWLAFALPADLDQLVIEEIYRGIDCACRRIGIVVVGGDTTSGVERLVCTTTVSGRVANREQLCPRSAAQVGQGLFVTGDLGKGAAGLHLAKQQLVDFPEIKDYFLNPRCRSDLIGQLPAIASAMIDISDGLSSEAWHLARASSVGLVIQAEALPISTEVCSYCQQFSKDPLELALNSGDEYQLLFTAPKALAVELKEVATLIGRVVTESGVFLSIGEELRPLAAGGFQHF